MAAAAQKVHDFPNLVLSEKQGAFLMDGSGAVAAITGRGGGKTTVGAIKTLAFLVRNAGCTFMVTAPTYKMLYDAPAKAIREWWPSGLFKGGFDVKEPTQFSLVNGSTVLLRSTEDPDALRGPNLAGAWMDEAAYSTKAAYDALVGGVRQGGYDNQIFLTTTPRGFNWVYDVFKGRRRRSDGALHHWTTRDNPHNKEGYADRMAAGYSPEMVLQEIEGEFVAASATSFDGEWLRHLLDDVVCDPDLLVPGQENADRVAVRLWAPYIETHEYVLGIDPKGKGSDLMCAALIDWTFGHVMGEIVSENKDATVLRSACVRVARRYAALTAPERNGVGSEWPDELEKAGCRVYVKPRDPGQDRDAYRKWAHDHKGWWTANQADVLGPLQRFLRQHRLSTRSRYIAETALSWDQAADPHPPDILSAVGIGCAAGEQIFGEMGSSVAEAKRHLHGGLALSALGHGRRRAAPFVGR